jgi:hypothetical protein
MTRRRSQSRLLPLHPQARITARAEAALDAPGLRDRETEPRRRSLSLLTQSTMTNCFSCNDCKRAFSLLYDKSTKCPSCGGSPMASS